MRPRGAMADGARPHAWTDKRTHKLGKAGHGCGSHHWRGLAACKMTRTKDAQIIRVYLL